MSVIQFRRHATRYGLAPLARNNWPEETVAAASRMITQSTLKARGWTQKMIADVAGNPDATVRNPKYVSAAAMKLYHLVRIEYMETQPAFAEAQQKAKKRSESAKKVADRKYEETLKWANEVEIRVAQVIDLTSRACQHYNSRSDDFYATPEAIRTSATASR